MARRTLSLIVLCAFAATLTVVVPNRSLGAVEPGDGPAEIDDFETFSSPLQANPTGANRATVERTYRNLLGRDPDIIEMTRFLSLLERTMTESDIFVQVMGTPEFYQRSGGTVRRFVTELYMLTAERPPTRVELRRGIRTHRNTEARNRFKRRAVAEEVLSKLDYDVDGLRIKHLVVRRSETGYIDHINLFLNTRVRSRDTLVSALIDGEPVVGTVRYRQDGRHLRLVPTRPLLTTGNVVVVLTESTRRADGKLFLEAKRESLFPHIRVVAYYGNHQTRLLGVLGETGPEGAAVRVRAAANRFNEPGRPAVGAFELIATVAQGSAGGDGNYSHPSDLDDLQEWIDVARDEGMYVILDIQPGTSDFYTESIRYRELLLQPHVGLALDPEWRMPPGVRPGSRVGSVTAAEVNRVGEWLSDLVVDNNLPDKMFILHQFQSRMIQNRGDIVDRPGLQTIIHADGFGGRAIKLETYGIIKASPPFWNGFKLFIDEDTRIFQPADVLNFTTVPVPDLITYQ